MVQASNHCVASDFRDDPLIVSLLRQAVTTVGAPLPELDDATFELLMASYRERNGERSSTASFSVGKYQLDSHFSKFRSSFVKVLVECLQSQLDRLQGREAFWPALDSDSPDLVPDSVIERRLAIDDLTRLIDLDASEGVRTFDVLLCQALGRPPKSLRDNPLRPAVFFHALGQCWTRASGTDDDELLILGHFAPKIGAKIASLYPQMTALLRQGLGVPRPSSGILMPGGDERDGPLYSRLHESKAKTDVDQAHADAPLEPQAESANVSSTRLARNNPQDLARVLQTLEQVSSLFDGALLDDELPKEVRLVLARMQIPLVRTALSDPLLLGNSQHPLRRMLRDLMSPAVWKRGFGPSKDMQIMMMHLGVIVEMLKRDRRDAVRDTLLYEHLHTQFLALVSAPPPKMQNSAIVPAV
jgi:Protein of unknown function (DUF1631)